MERFPWDLSHFSFVCGDIGRLQTLSVIPVTAGDSMSASVNTVVRLSSLRRNLTLDVVVDLFAFFVPHRHVYGSDWQDFIKQGVDETVTLTAGPTDEGARYLGHARRNSGAAMPLWLTAGYNRIWNRYFRAPTDTAAILADNYVAALATEQKTYRFGKLCGRLKTPWSTGIDATTTAADREVASVSVLDIVDLAQIQARYETEQLRDWFGQRYRDILGAGWGGGANPDADERPFLLMREKQSLSGYDVDGTDDASLGSFSGKAAGTVSMRVPSRFFQEHGALWLMALLRFPTIFNLERHPLMSLPNPTYKEIACDPEIMAAEPPFVEAADRWFAGGSGAQTYGTVPFGQEFRYHPNYVHTEYEALTGFPFVVSHPTTHDAARYHVDGEYDASFATLQLGQWQMSSHIGCGVKRVVPPPRTSIFAGTRTGR